VHQEILYMVHVELLRCCKYYDMDMYQSVMFPIGMWPHVTLTVV